MFINIAGVICVNGEKVTFVGGSYTINQDVTMGRA